MCEQRGGGVGRAEGKGASLLQPQEARQDLGPGVPGRTERDCSARVPPRSGLCGTAAASANFRLARTCEHLGAN